MFWRRAEWHQQPVRDLARDVPGAGAARCKNIASKQARGLGPGVGADVTAVMTWGEADQAGMLWLHFTRGLRAENVIWFGLNVPPLLSSGD